MKRRPLLSGVLLFVIGQVIGMKPIIVLGLAMIGLCYLFFRRRGFFGKRNRQTSKPFFYLGMGLMLGLGVLNGIRCRLSDAFLEDIEARNQTEQLTTTVTGTVLRIEEQETQDILELLYNNEEQSGWKRYHIRVYLKRSGEYGRQKQADITADSRLRIGDRITCIMRLNVPVKPTNPGEFNSYLYYRARGIHLIGYADSYELLERGGSRDRLCELLYELQMRAKQIYELALEEEHAGLMEAIVLGMTGDLDSELRALYQSNGIAHILSISALHISILGSALYHLLRKMGLPYVSAGVPVIFVLLAYAWMTGFSGSTIRAVMMFILLLMGDMVGRTYDMLTAAGAACLYMLLETPIRILDAGFLLSFSAVVTFGYVIPQCEAWIRQEWEADDRPRRSDRRDYGRKRCWIRRAVGKWLYKKTWWRAPLSGILLQMVTAPIVIHYYYEYPLYAFLLNLIVVPLMTPLLICGMVGVFSYMLIPSLGIALLQPCGWILSFYTWLCVHAEQLPFAILTIGHLPVWKIALYYGMLTGSYLCLRYRRNFGVPFLLAGYAACMVLSEPSGLTITMLDIGQGDCILLQMPNREMVLIDGGSSSRSYIGRYVITPAVKYYGRRQIDYVFVSHADSDHISGIEELIAASGQGGIRICNMILPTLAEGDTSFAPLIEAAEEAGIPVYIIAEQGSVSIGGVDLQCLYPNAEEAYGKDKNNSSMVLSLQYASFSMLFTGDLEKEGEQCLMSRQELGHYDVLKVGHHGSSGASSDRFLKAVAPKFAILSCGRRSRYGHPHAETLQRLEEAGAYLYRTDQDGAIIIRVDQRHANIHGFVNP